MHEWETCFPSNQFMHVNVFIRSILIWFQVFRVVTIRFLGLFWKVYNADGEFLFKFGSHGEGNGQFNAPTGVAVDANGNIIVADWGNSRIQVRLTSKENL